MVIGPSAFRIAGDDAEGEAVIIISNKNVSVRENDVVRITGPVKRFDRQAFERELDADLSGPAFDDFAADSAIAAADVDVIRPGA